MEVMWQTFRGNQWTLKSKIEYLQRKLLLNSIAYYIFDVSPLSDSDYDDLGKQLIELQSEYGDVKDTRYGYVFYDFEGSTGFYLYYRLTEKDKQYLIDIADYVLNKEVVSN